MQNFLKIIFNRRGKYFPVQHGRRMISAFPPYPCLLKAVRLCLSACSSCIRSDSSVAAASFSFKASVSRCTAPPCWTGVKVCFRLFIKILSCYSNGTCVKFNHT